MSASAGGGKQLAKGFGGGKYEVSHIVGKGAYGQVWAGRCKHTGKKVAIKHIDRVFQVREDAIRILRELRLLRLLQHPKIVAVEDVLIPSDKNTFEDVHIVFELFDTDLNQMIRSETKYDESHRRWIVYQVLHGLRHMHSAGVIHRDLKPANILVNANCNVKICDLGMARARLYGDEADDLATWTDYVTSRWYRAPELIAGYTKPYTNKIDNWSIGCIMAELMSRKTLFPGRNGNGQLELITNLVGGPSDAYMQAVKRGPDGRAFLEGMKGKREKPLTSVLSSVDPLALELLKELLRFDPADRITAADAVVHPYFETIIKMPEAYIPCFDPPGPAKQYTFDFEGRKGVSRETLRKLMFEEINRQADVAAPEPEPERSSLARKLRRTPSSDQEAAGGKHGSKSGRSSKSSVITGKNSVNNGKSGSTSTSRGSKITSKT